VKVADYQNAYYDMSGKASDIARTLSLAGLGLIWIFKLDDPEGVRLAVDLVRAAAWIVAALILDITQYLYLSVVWLAVSYVYEKKYGHAADNLSHSPWLPRVAEMIFAAKIICLAVGYWLIGSHLLERIRIG
jgi:hypothetical protein